MPDVAILCGGQGSRLRPALPDLPKGLAPIQGGAFLDLLAAQLEPKLFPRLVMCVGVGAQSIRDHFAQDARVVCSEEAAPLGTGGALGLAKAQLRSDPIVAMNGDSLVPGLNWSAFLHRRAPAMVLVPADSRTDAGVHAVSAEERVCAGRGFHSAGIYLLPQAWLSETPSGRPVSLEQELLPKWIRRGMQAFVHRGELIDIGTPERWAEAQIKLS